MMEALRLKDVKLKDMVGRRVQLTFIAKDVSVRPQRDKVTKMLCMNMADIGSLVDAKIFNVSDATIDKVVNGKLYDAMVDIATYDKSPSGISCIISDIQPSQMDIALFADWSDNIAQSRTCIEKTLQAIIGSTYGIIAYNIILKKWGEFQYWTAASGMHHTQLGGLMVHTAEVAELAENMADYFNLRYGYAIVNKNLLLAAALLHDVEKLSELNVDMQSGYTEYSTGAALSSHIMGVLSDVDIQAYELGIGMPRKTVGADGTEVDKPDSQIEKEKEEIQLLKHCLAAHHGKLEWGSPIAPSVPEAYILHKVDEISAEMFRYARSFKDMEAGTSTTKWELGQKVTTYKETSK